MIQTNLHMLLAKKRMSQKALAEATNINKNTISRYYNNTFEKFDKEHMDILCRTLKCNIQDIIFYIPDEETDTPSLSKFITEDELNKIIKD